MRFVFLIGMLAALSGCASYRDVSFHLLSRTRRTARRSRGRPSFTPWRNKECAKYGMRASYNWSNYFPDFQRVRVNYLCVQ